MFNELGAQLVSDFCDAENPASARVMERAGMQLMAQWDAHDERLGGTRHYLEFGMRRPTGAQR